MKTGGRADGDRAGKHEGLVILLAEWTGDGWHRGNWCAGGEVRDSEHKEM